MNKNIIENVSLYIGGKDILKRRKREAKRKNEWMSAKVQGNVIVVGEWNIEGASKNRHN